MAESKKEKVWIVLKARSGSKSSRYDRELIEDGEAIAALLTSKKAKQSEFAQATLDDFLGSIHALILAFHNDPPFKYRGKWQKIDPRAVLKRARGIAQAHKIRTDGKWMAGFHFNSALFRLSAVYHRTLKIVIGRPKSTDNIGDEKKPDSLISKAKKIYNRWTDVTWSNVGIKKVHDEVNDLKHSSAGLYLGRDVNESDAILAVNELLVLLKEWEAQP